MATSKIVYQGELRTEATHLQSNNSIFTDAPTDNNGKGENYSPTDLVATALASCAMTIMGIVANNHNILFKNATAEVVKIMGTEPRRIVEVKVGFTLDAQLNQKERSILENAAKTCPVAKSLHQDIIQNISFNYL